MLRINLGALRPLLILGLLPICLVAGTQLRADAVVRVGDTVEFKLEDKEDTSGVDLTTMRCDGKAYYRLDGSTLQVVGTIKCKFDNPYTPDQDDWNEAHDASLEISGSTPAGASCGGTDGDDVDLNDGWNFATGPMVSGLTFPAPDCVVNQICLHFYGKYDSFTTGWNDIESTFYVCKALPMGAPPGPGAGGSCGDVHVSVPEYGAVTWGKYGRNPAESNYAWSAEATATVSGATVGTWRLYVVLSQNSGSSVNSNWYGLTGHSNFPNGWNLMLSSESTKIATGSGAALNLANLHSRSTKTSTATPGAVPVSSTVLGVGVFKVSGNTSNDSGRLLSWATEGRIGMTDPARCAFYWGTPIGASGTAFDTPVGDYEDVAEVPEEPDTSVPTPDGRESCNFDVSSPSTWLEAGMCAAVGLLGEILGVLGSILDTVLGLASAIVNGILNGLAALFIPSPGFMDDTMTDVKDAWSDTGPVTFLDGVGDVGEAMQIPEPSGCGGPSLNITNPVGGDAVSLQPMSACRPEMATLASIIKAALTAMVYIGGFLAAVRIVGASLGLDLAIGKGGDE